LSASVADHVNVSKDFVAGFDDVKDKSLDDPENLCCGRFIGG